ncbi:20766_t:CDS:1 [Cetraspora pellucida]|uniref:Small ribosomal subunit protein uS3m n=1 Tax=Cetraspora pellucida TaxID=1433469 RepID=A0A9N9BVR0_9GLOM|nr:20766_t:CDS:1 [Cetraspora pellucida]
MNTAKALRLKSKINWTSDQFLFHPRRNRTIIYDLNALTALEHYMQKTLSDITIKHTPTKVVFQQYYYTNATQGQRRELEDTANGSTKGNNEIFNSTALNKLKERLSRLYNKDVEFNLIKQHYPYLNSKILAQYIALNASRYRFRQIRRSLFKKIPLVGGNPQQNDLNATSALRWIQLSRLGQQILPTHLSGVKIQISGRMSLRKGSARTSVINKSIGSFRFHSLKNTMIDYAKVERKNQNGAYCVKVWLSSSVVT